MTEAIKMVTEFGLKKAGFVRMQARVIPGNIGSWKALEKSGYQREALLRKYSFDKEFRDCYMYSAIQ
jgi:Acetyltransferases, including N-acetylases of ribosomal proteins